MPLKIGIKPEYNGGSRIFSSGGFPKSFENFVEFFGSIKLIFRALLEHHKESIFLRRWQVFIKKSTKIAKFWKNCLYGTCSPSILLNIDAEGAFIKIFGLVAENGCHKIIPEGCHKTKQHGWCCFVL